MNIQFVNDGPAQALQHLHQLAGQSAHKTAPRPDFANAQERSFKVQEMVRAKMQSSGLNYGPAFQAVQREHPEIFSGMKNVEIMR